MEILKLAPVFKDYLWGGTRLKTEYGKKTSLPKVAESWECSVHPDGSSVIVNGAFAGKSLKEVLEKHPQYLGTKVKNGELPVLVKLIDAKDNLSVQVHPDDEYSRKMEGQNGKTEMWYIIDADENAGIIYGFLHAVTPEILRHAIKEGSLDRHLQWLPVKKGEVYFVPAGVVHGIGAGTLLAEIQESSNVTYRVYDYERIDKNGKKRELHLEKAMEVMDMRADMQMRKRPRIVRYMPGCSCEVLCRCKYFETERVQMTELYEFTVASSSFQVLMCINGYGMINSQDTGLEAISFKKGETFFIPAGIGRCSVAGKATLLKVRC